MDKAYLIDTPGLAEAVSASAIDAKHKALARVIGGFPALANVRFGNQRGDRYLVRAKVLNKDGDLVSDDHEAWLGAQLEQDSGKMHRTYERLRNEGYALTKCELESLVFVHDRGGPQSNFVQVHVDLETEYVDRPLFDYPMLSFSVPGDVRDLLRCAAPPFKDRRIYQPPRYRLQQVIDVTRFMDEANAEHEKTRQAARTRMFEVTETQQWLGGSTRTYVASAASLDPGFEDFPWWKGQRLFNDWTLSSAGRSGARLCEHWVMEISDYTGRDGRHLTMIPSWTHTMKMAEVQRAPDIHALLSKLQSIDRRTGVPFAWYFYMLHGNRVGDGAGKSVLDAAERGEIFLPEHDYQVLKRWRTRPYGF